MPRGVVGLAPAVWIVAAVASVFLLRTASQLLIPILLARKRIVEITGTRLERRQMTATIIDDINAQIQRFLLVNLVTAAVVALATWGALAWMGVGQAAVWGILAGLAVPMPVIVKSVADHVESLKPLSRLMAP